MRLAVVESAQLVPVVVRPVAPVAAVDHLQRTVDTAELQGVPTMLLLVVVLVLVLVVLAQ